MDSRSTQPDPYIYKFLRSIKYNGVFIIISVLFPLLFIKMDAGRELFIQLADSEQWYNNSLIIAAFHLLTLSMWCFPALAVSLFIFLTHSGKGNRQVYTDDLAKTYLNDDDGKSISRFWAAIPFIVFNITLLSIQFGKWWGLVFIVVSVAYVLLDKKYKLSYRLKGVSGRKLNQFMVKYEWTMYLLQLMLYILVPFIIKSFPELALKLCLTFCYLLSMILVFWHQFVLDTTQPARYARLEEEESNRKAFNSDKRRHCLIMVLLGIIITVLYILMCHALLPLISPIFVSISIASILIISFELMVSTQVVLARIANHYENKLRYKIYEVAVILCCIGMIYSYFAHSINNGNIRTEIVLEADKIPGNYQQYGLDTFFNNWYEDRLGTLYDTTDTSAYHTVYLISGQGGGSRAGAWFLMAMKYLEQTDPDIYRKTFSISAVSGSITGANMYIASKQFHLLDSTKYLLPVDPNDPGQQDSVERVLNRDPILNFVKDIYSKNYLSSGILGLTLSDYFIDGVRCNLGSSNRDRNYHFQNEEIESFLSAAACGNRPKDSAELIRQYFLNDYMYNYRDIQRTDVPVFLINTTIIETGRKAIFSPIKLSSFSIFEDVYDNFRDCGSNRFRALPLITCVNQGQAFPMLNTYNQIHGTGRLGDGGLYENSGTETTQELYEQLYKLIQSAPKNKLKKVKLVCITILNSPIRNEEVPKSSNSYLGTLQFAAANPFKGRERTAIERLNNLLNPKLYNNHAILQPKQSYSLTRALSKQTINRMYLDLINNMDFRTSFINPIALAANTDEHNKRGGTKTEQHTLTLGSNDSLVTNAIAEKDTVNPHVFIHATTAQMSRANSIKTLLAAMSMTAYTPETINQDYENNVRYFNASDAKSAALICDRLNKHTRSTRRFVVLDLSQSFPNIPKGQIEIWTGKP